MKILPIVSCFFLTNCSAIPTAPFNVPVTEEFFEKGTVLYTAQHDIVNIFVPINQFNTDEEDFNGAVTDEQKRRIVFFVEADINNGTKKYKGLYVYANGKATKLLDNGRDIVATCSNDIYLAASDGIYKYDQTTNSAVKYGSVTDNVVQLAHNFVSNENYYLTANHEVFKLNADGSTGDKLSNINDVQEMAFGLRGHLYYRDSGNKVYVLSDINDAPKKYSDLPSKINKIKLIGPAEGIKDEVLLMVNEDLYFLHSNARVSISVLKLQIEPTAYEPRATEIQFIAKDKKLYEFKILNSIMLQDMMTGSAFMFYEQTKF